MPAAAIPAAPSPATCKNPLRVMFSITVQPPLLRSGEALRVDLRIERKGFSATDLPCRKISRIEETYSQLSSPAQWRPAIRPQTMFSPLPPPEMP